MTERQLPNLFIEILGYIFKIIDSKHTSLTKLKIDTAHKTWT